MMTFASSRGEDNTEAHVLVDPIMQLTEHVRELIVVLDECLVELQWRNNQRVDSTGDSPVLLTSMSIDPTSEQWRINELSAADLPATSPDARPRTLFD